MYSRNYFFTLISFIGFLLIIKAQEPINKLLHNAFINDFKLKNFDKSIISLSNYKEAKGFIIVFTCNHCPFAKLYSKRFNALNSKYKKLGVPLIAINSMDTLIYEEENFEGLKIKAIIEKFNFPYLSDASQETGKNFGALFTPQAFVIWKEENKWIIKYNGAIDNNAEHPDKAKSYISEAVDQILNHKLVLNPKTDSFGCKIFYRN